VKKKKAHKPRARMNVLHFPGGRLYDAEINALMDKFGLVFAAVIALTADPLADCTMDLAAVDERLIPEFPDVLRRLADKLDAQINAQTEN
jgi:hypothetical protein